jgi:hypothetical protein
MHSYFDLGKICYKKYDKLISGLARGALTGHNCAATSIVEFIPCKLQ